MANMLPDMAIVAVILISVYTDLRYRKIYNALLLPAFLFALLYHGSSGGLSGLLTSLQGTLLGLVLLFIPFILGGMGAGDVKLLAVIGAWHGPQFVWFCFLCTALAGGLIAIVQLTKSGRLLTTFKMIILTFIPGVPKVNTFGTLATAKAGEAFPYGIAIAVGTLATYILR
ncbi:prepilin peptidase [Desulfotomaculum varum]